MSKTSKIRLALLGLLALFFVGSGLNHFFNHAFYLRMMPSYLPEHASLVCLSGIFEILGGVGILIPKTRRLAGYGLLLLLLAVFPANLNMALHSELFPDTPVWGLWLRLPFQLLFLYWVYWTTIRKTT